MAQIEFGNVPHPPFIDAIVKKPYDGAGYTRVPPRKPIGVCVHCWGGHAWTDPSWQSIYNLFSGERLYDALTDYSIQRDGSIVRLNDPFGTRAPWANGGINGLEGDGIAFVRAGFDVNARLVSIEHENNGEPMTSAQLASSIALQAWVHDQAKQPWETYPYHPNYKVVTSMQHFEFATKPCPLQGIRGQTDLYQDGVRGLMKKYQLRDEGSDPVPPVDPVPPTGQWPNGWTTSGLTKRFGGLIRFSDTGEVKEMAFNEKGPISNLWVARGEKEGIKTVGKLPKPLRWSRMNTVPDGIIDIIVFDVPVGKNWVLYGSSEKDRAGFMWVQ